MVEVEAVVAAVVEVLWEVDLVAEVALDLEDQVEEEEMETGTVPTLVVVIITLPGDQNVIDVKLLSREAGAEVAVAE